ncbi:hypothetical protein K501DRAFT_297565 [Backusella circina FSU 941]|nr:hypothetical protein K501DRAFT_297565 [Backusella circina FSU 941]
MSMGSIYVSDVPLPQLQEYQDDQPIKIRKKPGRKPNPASPALRKAQNRAAQRAFRERKERHLRDLEGTIKNLREQRNSAVKELNKTKKKLDGFRAENWYLKGVVLSLQFVCLHHNIHIPTHSPYLTEEALCEMAKTNPHAIEAYVNAYTRNNINLKPTMASHFSNSTRNESPEHLAENKPNEEHDQEQEEDDMEEDGDMMGQQSDAGRTAEETMSPESVYIKREEEEEDENMRLWLERHKREEREKEKTVYSDHHDRNNNEGNKDQQQQPSTSSVSAIQHIRLQLRLQTAVSQVGNSAARLQPTILQLAIPHDPRIDLIPTPHMRDRMIIFRDQMDYDRCFAMLLNGAVYHGGDPTMSASWELPPEFFTEFWYLAINYDFNRTNKWRRLKGLPELTVRPREEVWHTLQQPDNTTVWTDDVFAQMTEGMPTLQPLDDLHLASGFDFGSPHIQLDQLNHPIYEQVMGSPPATRPERSPSIGTMMNLMNSLSTDMT